MMPGPAVSVVICAHNAEATLEQQVDAVLAQETAVPFEIVIVDNESTDGTRALAMRYRQQDDRVRCVPAGPKGLNVARNAGIDAARAELIAMCDADDEVEAGWLSALLDAWRPGAYVSGALRYASPNSTEVRERWGALGAAPVLSEFRLNGMPTAAGGNCLFERSMWSRVGRFDERLSGAGDESEFFARAAGLGFEYVPAPAAVVGYRLPEHASDVLRRGLRYGLHSAKVQALSGSEPDAMKVSRRVLRMTWELTRVLRGDEGYYQWLHKVGKRSGEVVHLLERWRKGREERER